MKEVGLLVGDVVLLSFACALDDEREGVGSRLKWLLAADGKRRR